MHCQHCPLSNKGHGWEKTSHIYGKILRQTSLKNLLSLILRVPYTLYSVSQSVIPTFLGFGKEVEEETMGKVEL